MTGTHRYPVSDDNDNEDQKVDLHVDNKGDRNEQNNKGTKETSNTEFYRYYHGPKEEELEQTQHKEQSEQYLISKHFIVRDKTDFGRH